MKIQKKQAGFTLIELITVVSMLALLTIFIAREMGQSSDDIKLNLVATVLVSGVPAAIIADKATNAGNCTPALTQAQLITRGVPTKTPWGEDWTASYKADDREITVTYSLKGVRKVSDAIDKLIALMDDSSVFIAKPEKSGNNIVAKYSC